jgi:hypothetical protein
MPQVSSPKSKWRFAQMRPFWQRQLGSVAFTLIVLVVLFGRSIVAGQFDLPGLLAVLLLGTLLAYLAWPGIDHERWLRWKTPHR